MTNRLRWAESLRALDSPSVGSFLNLLHQQIIVWTTEKKNYYKCKQYENRHQNKRGNKACGCDDEVEQYLGHGERKREEAEINLQTLNTCWKWGHSTGKSPTGEPATFAVLFRICTDPDVTISSSP